MSTSKYRIDLSGKENYFYRDRKIVMKWKPTTFEFLIAIYRLKYVTPEQADKIWSIIMNKDTLVSRLTLSRWVDNGILGVRLGDSSFRRKVFFVTESFITYLHSQGLPRIYASSKVSPNYHDEFTRDTFIHALCAYSRSAPTRVSFYDLDFKFSPYYTKNEMTDPDSYQPPRYSMAEGAKDYRHTRTQGDLSANIGDIYFRHGGDEFILEYDAGTESSKRHLEKLRDYVKYLLLKPNTRVHLIFVFRDETSPIAKYKEFRKTPFVRIENVFKALYRDTTDFGESGLYTLSDYIVSNPNFELYSIAQRESANYISSLMREIDFSHENTSKNQEKDQNQAKKQALATLMSYLYQELNLRAEFQLLEKNKIRNLEDPSLFRNGISLVKSHDFDDSDDYLVYNPDATDDYKDLFTFDGLLTLKPLGGSLTSPEDTKIGVLFANERSYKDSVRIGAFITKYLNYRRWLELSPEDVVQALPVLVVYPSRKPINLMPGILPSQYKDFFEELVIEDKDVPLRFPTLYHPTLTGEDGDDLNDSISKRGLLKGFHCEYELPDILLMDGMNGKIQPRRPVWYVEKQHKKL